MSLVISAVSQTPSDKETAIHNLRVLGETGLIRIVLGVGHAHVRFLWDPNTEYTRPQITAFKSHCVRLHLVNALPRHNHMGLREPLSDQRREAKMIGEVQKRR
jgi:hypothetical protein